MDLNEIRSLKMSVLSLDVSIFRKGVCKQIGYHQEEFGNFTILIFYSRFDMEVL